MHAREHITAETVAEGESLQKSLIKSSVMDRKGDVRTKGIKKKVAEFVSECVIVRVCVCCTLTLVDQMEPSRAGLAFGGKADQDLVGGC